MTYMYVSMFLTHFRKNVDWDVNLKLKMNFELDQRLPALLLTQCRKMFTEL